MASENVINGAMISLDQNNLPQTKFGPIVCSNPSVLEKKNPNNLYHHFLLPKSRIGFTCCLNPNNNKPDSSPTCFVLFPWNRLFSNPSSKWSSEGHSVQEHDDPKAKNGLIGSLVYEGHVYSLAASGDFLYTGSDKKNLRVWRNLKDFSGLKSGSGLVKAIVVFGDKIFTGHQDGKIRIWRFLGDKRTSAYERIGKLPTTRDLIAKSIDPRNYVEFKRNRTGPWIKHHDAVSCMSVDVDKGLLYSGSWDKTLKVWRISDSKCLESIQAHNDAVNTVVAAFDVLVFTGGADGTVKSWRRKIVAGNHTRHALVEVLLKQLHAVTSLAASQEAAAVYAGSSNGLVNFWERGDKDSMAYRGVLRGHKQAVLCLAVGGNLVLSGGADKNICVWRREGGGVHSFVAVLSGHNGPVKCLAAEEDGDQRWIVYSGSLDKSVKVWRVVSERGLKLRELQ